MKIVKHIGAGLIACLSLAVSVNAHAKTKISLSYFQGTDESPLGEIRDFSSQELAFNFSSINYRLVLSAPYLSLAETSNQTSAKGLGDIKINISRRNILLESLQLRGTIGAEYKLVNTDNRLLSTGREDIGVYVQLAKTMNKHWLSSANVRYKWRNINTHRFDYAMRNAFDTSLNFSYVTTHKRVLGTGLFYRTKTSFDTIDKYGLNLYYRHPINQRISLTLSSTLATSSSDEHTQLWGASLHYKWN